MSGRFFLGVVLGVGVSFLSACGGNEEARRAAEGPARRVTVVDARLARVGDRHEATGTLRGQQTAVMTSKATGYVRELLVAPGDTVASGQPLAVLATPELRARLDAARAGLDEARQGEREAEAGVAAAEAQAEVAKSTYERFVALRDQRAVTRQEFDEVAARHASAAAGLEAARSRLARAASALARAEAEVQAAEIGVGYATVRAPFDGRVLERRADLGNLAAPGTPLFVIEKEGSLRAEVSVQESLAGRIGVGDPAEVVVGKDAGALEGVVSEVVPSVDPSSRAFLVKVDLPETGLRGVVPGRFARVSFRVGETERLLVPRSAVVARGQLDMVYVVEDGRVRLRLVTLGGARGESVEVLSGLSPGERVVDRPAADLVEGAPVEARS